MTTFAPANPLDFARADFSSFGVPHPVRAAVVDSYIKENRANTPLSAINERKQPRLTVSELNDMDMDEIKRRFYDTGIDTRGPVTKFLDLIDLPRNVLFNIAARDTARRKSQMGDTATFGLARVNTSDVLESLGVRPGLASGILGFLGDVALDPLTYVGPAGWGAKAASSAGRTVSYTRQGTKVLREAVDAVKAGRTASSPAVAKYLETLGHTTESIAAHPDKAKLASEIERTLLGGKRTKTNKILSVLGEDAEIAAVDNARTIADDIADYTHASRDAATNARVAAAKDVYREIGRPFSPGVRMYKDSTKPLGIGMTTSRDMAHGSGILHVPFTDIQVSVPAFTPYATQQGLIASLVKNGNATDNQNLELFKTAAENIDTKFHEYEQARDTYRTINNTTAAGVDLDFVRTPAEAHSDFLDYAFGPQQPDGIRTGGAVNQMHAALEAMEQDPLTSYADMLHAQDVFKAYSAKSQLAREEWQNAKNAVLTTGEFSTAVDQDVSKLVNTSIEKMRADQRSENMRRAAVRERVDQTVADIDNEYAQYVQARKDSNPAIKSDVDEAFGGYNKRTTGISKAQLSKNSDPAFYDTATQEWKDLRYTPPGQERDNLRRLAVGDSQTVDITESMYPDGVVPDDVERVYDSVPREESDILNDFVSKENQAFTGLQIGLKESGRFSGKVSKIDLSKVQPNDVWFMGDTQVKVVGVNPIDGTVDLEVLMPPENVDVTTTVVRPSEKTRGKKTKTTRQRTPTSVESQERPRYYTVSVDQTPYASRAAKKSEKVTVERLDEMGELDLFEPEPTLKREAARSMAFDRLGITPDDINDVRLGHGKPEFANLDEEGIKELETARILDEQRAKMASREDGAVPLYLNEAERIDRSAYADYLHAKAMAAQAIEEASKTPFLATAGSDVKAAVEAVRDSWGLGADDLGSGIMQSVASATNKFSPDNKWGQKLIHEARALERTFVNKMGLAPGLANDMVKQAVKAANITDTVAFKTATADMTKALLEAGFNRSELDTAGRLVTAYMFAGDEPIVELAKRDIAGQYIIDAIKSGILQDPKKAEAVKAVANKYRSILAKLDDGTGIQNYVPNVLTPQSENIINYQRNNQTNIIGARERDPARPAEMNPVQKMLQSFEKKRSTLEHAWTDPATNQQIRVLESELAYLQYSENDLAAIAQQDPDFYRYLARKIEHAKLYESLTEADKLTMVKSYYLSPLEINRRVAEGHLFKTLTNNALNGNDFMHANAIAAVSARLGSQERKYANELLQQYLAPHTLRLSDIELAQDKTASGAKTQLKTIQGTPVTVTNENGTKVVYLGNRRYRRPRIEISEDFSALKDMYTTPGGKPIAADFFPEEIADIIDDTAGFFSDKASGGMAKAFGEADAATRMTAILKGADTLSGYWKVFTLLHPSWTINDILGNLFFMANMGINPSAAVKNAKEAWKMVRAQAAGDRDILREMTVKGRSAADHFDDALGQVVGSHQGADATMHLRQSGETIEPFQTSLGSMAGKAVRGDFAGAKAEGRQMVRESWDAAGKTIDNQNVSRPLATPEGKAVKQPINALFQQGLIRRVWQPWAHLNGMANDWLKVTAYLSLLDDGYDAASAARLISEKMLDMSVLTSTDRSVRKFVPFHCVPDHSEILTRNGFVKRTELKVGDEILTHNIETDALEWDKCLEVCDFDYDQDIVVWESGKKKIECTENHRWVTRSTRDKSTLLLKEMRDINSADQIVIGSCLSDAEKSSITEEDAVLLGWLFTDGTYRWRGNHCEAVIYQSPNKFIDEVCRVAGGKPRTPHPQTGVIAVPVLKERVERIKKYLKPDFNISTIPCMLSKNVAESMYKAMYMADGTVAMHRGPKDSEFFAATLPDVKECFRILAFILGKQTTPNCNPGCHISDNRVVTCAKPSFRVSSQHYKGKVWCPRTKNGTWVMRQNDVITVTGNTWMKSSAVLGAREFLRNPKFFTIAPKVKHALEESFNGEQNLPENARPSWIRDQLALQIGTDMDTRRALTLTSSLPTEAATYGLSFLFSPFMGAGALQDSLAYGINSLTPAVKIPLELGSRREFFTKRTIDAQGGDITPGEYMMQQIRPFRELGIGSLRGGPLQRAFSDSPVMGISRMLVGGRLQPFDEERRVQNLQREYDDRVDALRRRIGIAERESQKEESLRRRIELLQLFNQMQTLGLTIPKWASGQIEGISASPTAN